MKFRSAYHPPRTVRGVWYVGLAFGSSARLVSSAPYGTVAYGTLEFPGGTLVFSALSALALGARQFSRRATIRELIWLPPVALENLYKGGPLVVSRHNCDFGYPRKKLPKTYRYH